MKFRSASALLLAICFSLAVPTQAQVVVYDNTSQSLNAVAVLPYEYGDEILLAGTERQIQLFAFEYYGKFFSQGDEWMRVRFYAADGGGWIQPNGLPSTDYIMPGTVLWDSGLHPIQQGYNTKAFQAEFVANPVIVPTKLIWTVQFYGLTQTSSGGVEDQAGLLFYLYPTIGQNYPDIWEKRAVGWTPTERGDQRNNFAAYIVAVPEPSVAALGAVAIIFGSWRFLRRRQE